MNKGPGLAGRIFNEKEAEEFTQSYPSLEIAGKQQEYYKVEAAL